MHCASSIHPPPTTSKASRSDQILNPPQPLDRIKFWIFQGAIKHVIIYPSRLQSRANFYSLEETSYHLFPMLGLKSPRLSPNYKDLNLHHHICTFVSTLGLRLFVVQNTTIRSTFVPWWYSYPFPFAHVFPKASKFLHQIAGMLFKTLFPMHCSFGSKPNLFLILSQDLKPPSFEFHKSPIFLSLAWSISCALKIDNPNSPPLKEVPHHKLTFLMDATIKGG